MDASASVLRMESVPQRGQSKVKIYITFESVESPLKYIYIASHRISRFIWFIFNFNFFEVS